jgi:hypothetical protein
MDDLGARLHQLFSLILVPGHWLMQRLGLEPTDLQVWALMVGVFMLTLGGASAYVDIILMQRRVRTTGTIVRIDRDDVDTPRIAFADVHGRTHEFSSSLPVRGGADTMGDTVAVIYDPQNPRRVREAGRPILKVLGAVVWFGLASVTLSYAFGVIPAA